MKIKSIDSHSFIDQAILYITYKFIYKCYDKYIFCDNNFWQRLLQFDLINNKDCHSIKDHIIYILINIYLDIYFNILIYLKIDGTIINNI